MIKRMVERANADKVLVGRGRFIDIAFAIESCATRHIIKVDHGKVRDATGDGIEPAFTLKADDAAWADFARPVPPPGTHDILALLEGDLLTIEGDPLILFRYLMYVKLLLDKGRGEEVHA